MFDYSVVPKGRSFTEVEFTFWVYGSLVNRVSGQMVLSLSEDADDIHSPDFITKLFLPGSDMGFYLLVALRSPQRPIMALFTEETEDAVPEFVDKWVVADLSQTVATSIGNAAFEAMKSYSTKKLGKLENEYIFSWRSRRNRQKLLGH